MPGPFFHVGATAMCPHGGQVTTISADARVMVNGMPVALVADQYVIAGCPGVPPANAPCLLVQWTAPSVRTLVMGQPAILATSVGLCVGGTPGPAVVVTTQPRVVAT